MTIRPRRAASASTTPAARSPRKPDTPAKPRLSKTEQRVAAARQAVRHLRRADARLGKLIARIGVYRPIITPDPFHTLIGSIVHQQVSMSAARTIHRRLLEAAGRPLTPEKLLRVSDEQARGAGLSRQKVRYVRSVAEHFADGRLSRRALRALDDEAVIAATTQVVGVGRWTAEMLLMFCLERPDVWPVDDLGLRKALQVFHGLEEMPDRSRANELGAALRPYRTYAAWYLWRSLEGPLMPGLAVD